MIAQLANFPESAWIIYKLKTCVYKQKKYF